MTGRSRLTALLLVLQSLFGAALPHVHGPADCGHGFTRIRPHVHLPTPSSGLSTDCTHHEAASHRHTGEASRVPRVELFGPCSPDHELNAVYLGDGSGDARRRDPWSPDQGPADSFAECVTETVMTVPPLSARPGLLIRVDNIVPTRNSPLRV